MFSQKKNKNLHDYFYFFCWVAGLARFAGFASFAGVRRAGPKLVNQRVHVALFRPKAHRTINTRANGGKVQLLTKIPLLIQAKCYKLFRLRYPTVAGK